ncbi:Shedu immune nuclease family protein [Faunimonas sp. B44]|uniref:Shedu immune nuclease family protein n=1 Tax=Faunimonas sp. B44 TaxID=3461493 RepID=UPI0040449BBF
MSDEYDERRWFFDRRTDKTIISKRITDSLSGQKLRIASHIVEGQPGLKFAAVEDEVLLRQTPAGRYEIKATFLEDDRSIRTLTIQRYSSKNGPLDKQCFSFVGREIETLISFVAGVRTVPLDGTEKVHLPDNVLRDIVLDQGQARRIFAKNPELFLQLAQYEDITRDLVAVGYRRKQLQRFESLLREADYFVGEQERLQCRPEDVWQQFFEANTWIFGYGLSYQFVSKLDERKLEQIVRGRDLTAAGKRSDALMKTRGIISSLCFVEIKRHDTPLLGSAQYRSDVWPPSAELTGGVSQLQTTVHAALESLGHKLMPRDDTGDPTGEILFNIEPRSCLVVGSLNQFQTDRGINVPKFRSFELYRRHTWRPEIITFDKLLQRARFIVEHGPEVAAGEGNDDDEIPF